MSYGLPKSVTIGGEEFAIRYDFRVILEIYEVLQDPDLTDNQRAQDVLQMFYLDWEHIPDYNAAIQQLFWFMNQGQEQRSQKKQPVLVDWQKDFPIIVSPVNHVLGYESRAVPYDAEANTGGVHWWTWLAAYMEISGDCLFAQVVGIRSKKAKGKKLDKSDQEFYRRNRELIDIETRYTEQEKNLLAEWI